MKRGNGKVPVLLLVSVAVFAVSCTKQKPKFAEKGVFEAYLSASKAADAGDMQLASNKWSETIALTEKLPAPRSRLVQLMQADSLMGISVILHKIGKLEAETALYERALGLYTSVTKTNAEFLGRDMAQRISQNRELAQLVAKVESGARRGRAICLEKIGLDLCGLNKSDEGMLKLQEALAIFRSLEGSVPDQALCLNCIGVSLLMTNKCSESIAVFEEALVLLRSHPGTEKEQAESLLNISGALLVSKKNEECVEKGKEALEIYQKIPGTRDKQSQCITVICNALIMLGRVDEFKKFAEQMKE